MRRPAPGTVDAGLAVVFVVVGQVEPLVRTQDGYAGGHPLVTHLTGLLVSVPLAWRSRSPWAAWIAACTGLLLVSVGWEHGLFFWSHLLPLVLLAYAVARRLDGWRGRWSWVLGLVAVSSEMLRVPSAREPSNLVFTVLALGGCALAGRLVRRGTTNATRLAAALADLEDAQRAAELSAAAGERARIAVEVHDVVAHALGSMLVQVGAARLGLEAAGADVPLQLVAAEDTGRRALGELRRSVGVLGPTSSDTEPLPDLSHVPQLVAGFRAAGLDVVLDLDVVGELPGGLQLTVYRLLQESLTNALRHAGSVPVHAVVERDGDRLLVEVVNDLGRGPRPSWPGGHGLVGMRQRAAMFDGHVDARVEGPRFVVRAVLAVPAALSPAVSP